FGRSCWLITGKLRFLSNHENVPACHRTCESCEVYQWHMALAGRRTLDSGSELVREEKPSTIKSGQDFNYCILPQSDHEQTQLLKRRKLENA
ncbi:MAG: hypothetical protein ACP5VS_05210, partial [Desulfomonilaceae bacterium]